MADTDSTIVDTHSRETEKVSAIASETPSTIVWNRCPPSIGIGVRNPSEYALLWGIAQHTPQKKPIGAAMTVGGIGLAAAAFGLFLPYFMAVLFVPVGLICSFYAFARQARLLGGIGIVVGLLGIVGIITTSQRIADIGGDSAKTHHVRYALDGTAYAAQITIQNSAGGTEQHTVSVPWSMEFEARGGSFVYPSGQNQGSGRLKAAIYVDGTSLQEAESTEEYGIASVSGTVK